MSNEIEHKIMALQCEIVRLAEMNKIIPIELVKELNNLLIEAGYE